MKRDLIAAYLDRYAEPEAASVPAISPRENVLVIPAFDERIESLTAVWQHIRQPFVVVVVVNATTLHANTQTLYRQLLTHWGADPSPEKQAAKVQFLRGSSVLPDLVLINRCHEDCLLPAKQGVGLARKIGVDVALRLLSRSEIDSAFIHTTDADVVLPPDYFSPAYGAADATDTLVFPFVHMASADLILPSALYDLSLLYYAANIKAAGSAYGHTSIGSAIAFSGAAYAAVRGFPKRQAGEDFYLLNKLAKVTRIGAANCQPIKITARLSDRVPFGTGPSLYKISQLSHPERDYLYYHPECFTLLGQFLNALRAGANLEEVKTIHESVAALAEDWRLEEQFARQRQQFDEPGFQKFLHDWFDGFRTLKFVHYLRDHGLPPVPLNQTGIPGTTLAEKRQFLNNRLFPVSS